MNSKEEGMISFMNGSRRAGQEQAARKQVKQDRSSGARKHARLAAGWHVRKVGM